jgi:class 3 adenylate cyclase
MPACGGCGAQAPAGARFCPACGARLDIAAPAGESRRRVTVLFSDLAGSTALGERLDPETLRRVMARYYDEMRAVIERHGGSLEKFIGDAVMAVFGIPARREDDALRAVRAADEMRAAQEALNDQLEAGYGVRLQVRTGVNTGEVVAGDPGTGQAFVVGDAVNVAARLEQAAAAGEILVGAETERLVRDAAVLEPVAALGLKGKAELVPAFRLVAAAGATARPSDGAGPLVGREAELAALRAAFERCAGGGCELIPVIGAAGIGKSRLVRELEVELGGRARFLYGRCLSYGEGGTYWPVAEIVRAAAGIQLADPPEVARERLAALGAGGEAAASVAGVLASMIGLDDAPHRPEEATWAVRLLLRRLAADRPLVLVIDDLHWAEPALLDLVADVAGGDDGSAVLLAALARPELLELRGDLAADGLTLEPLGEADRRRLVGDAEPGVAERIAEVAGGNPLFVRELLRSLLEEGAVERRDGALVATRPLDELPLPPTLEAVLGARLERLATGERAVAEGASVVGEAFERGEAHELAPDPVRPVLDPCLAALVRHDVIVEAGETAFRFAHLMIRDVTYQGMLKERRAELHERFADWLERRAGERVGEVEDILAFHLERAYRYRAALAPVGEAELRLARRAALHLVSAGQRALARLDRAGAMKLLRAGRELLPDDDRDSLEAGLELANALAESGDMEAAQREAGVVQRLATATGADDLALRARLEEVEYLTWSDPRAGRVATEQIAHEAVRRFGATGDRRGLARAWRAVGMWHFGAGRMNAAGEALAAAVEHAKAAGDERAAREMWPWHLTATLVWGGLPATEAILRVHRHLAEVHGRPFDELHLRMILMHLLFLQQRSDEARQLWRGLVTALAEVGSGREALIVEYVYAQGEWMAGETAVAEPHLRHVFEEADEGFRWSAGLDLAEMLIEHGSCDEAERVCDGAAAETPEEDVQVEVAWRAVKAQSLAQRGEIEPAERLAREAVRLADGMELPDDQARALLALTCALDFAGRRDEADSAFAAAVETYQRKEHLSGVARARRVREAWLGRATVAR